MANTCGSTVNQNNSYIQSPNYPAASSTGMCMFNIEKCDSNICQYKYVNYTYCLKNIILFVTQKYFLSHRKYFLSHRKYLPIKYFPG